MIMDKTKINGHYNKKGQLDLKTKIFNEFPMNIMVQMEKTDNEKWDIKAFNYKQNPHNDLVKYESKCGKKGLSYKEANTIFESIIDVKDIYPKLCKFD